MCDRKKSIVFSCITFWYSKKEKKGKKEKENIKWNIFSWRFTYNACLSAYTESNRPTRKMLPIHWRNNLNACVPATHASVPDNAGSVSFHHHDNLKFLCQCVFFFFFFFFFFFAFFFFFFFWTHRIALCFLVFSTHNCITSFGDYTCPQTPTN